MSKINLVLFLLCSFLYGTSLQGQSDGNAQSEGDKLWDSFVNADTDSLAFQTFNRLYMYNIGRDLDRSKELLVVMDSLCNSINFDDCRALENLFKGYYYRMTGSYDASLEFLKESHKQYEKLGNESKMAVTLFNQGVVISYKGDYDGAIQKYILARELYERVGNVNGSINVSNSIGIIYKNIEDYGKAKDSYLNAEKLALESDNKAMLAMVYNNISNLYNTEGGKEDSVLFYAEKALVLEKELKRNTGIASAYNLISAVYLNKADYEKALQNTQQALKYSRASKNNRFMAIHEMALGDIYSNLKNFELAEKHFISAIALADSISLLKSQKEGRQKYSELLADMGEYERAFQQRLIFEEHQDSIKIRESRSEIADLEAKYETAIKDKLLEEQKLEINQKTYQRNFLIGGLGLLALLAASIIWGVLSRLRRNKEIAFRNQKIQSQQIQVLEQEKNLLSMSSLLEGQESERIRIAKDLHDGLGALLTTVKAHISSIQKEIEKIGKIGLFQSANVMIDKAHDEVRRISHNLMPSDLRAGGLPLTIKQLVHELRTIHHLETEFEMLGFQDIRLDEKIELSTYRIFQELINNILKYAKAEKVFIQLSKFDHEIQVIVEDDGVGFDYEGALNSDGLGLKSISSRVNQLKGNMDVVSSIGKGTSVTINIPL